MFSRVIVPLDTSPMAEIALDYIPAIVNSDGQIVLVHVLMPLDPLPPFYHPDHVLVRYESAREYLKMIADRMMANSSLKVSFEILVGMLSVQIAELATRIQADAICMVTHGQRNIRGILAGSNAQHVMAHAACPVFLIPALSVPVADEEAVKTETTETS